MSTYEYEPTPGLPEVLPEDEYVVWQGSPSTWGMAVDVFHIRKAMLYFSVFVVLRGLAHGDNGLAGALWAALQVVPLAALGLAILGSLAWVHARSTLYTITNRRVVFRHGVAIQMMVNLPFEALTDASFRSRGAWGDLPMRFRGEYGPSYAHLWPHVRPWRWQHPEPAMRAVPNIEVVAQQLAKVVKSHQGASEKAAPTTASAPVRSPEPQWVNA